MRARLDAHRAFSVAGLERGVEIALDGAEAVVPLEENTKWIKRVADEMQTAFISGKNVMNGGASFVGDDITINVYASQGMDVNALATAVEQRLARVQRQRQEVWAWEKPLLLAI